MLSFEQIKRLYEEYIQIVHLEVEQFGCKATEVRHLIGRLGEFYCALKTEGTLSHRTNQHGFDVIGKDERKISVKTTAQKSGFITINPKTLDIADDLMILQFSDFEFEIIYYGPIKDVIGDSRTWEGKYELDLSKAKRLNK
ncbi:MAG: hypothetical protein KDC79_12270 [Cyclobacteriaceae bacterium]|nr:hypothetical protein [Cyclobacteriaceae bacterium]